MSPLIEVLLGAIVIVWLASYLARTILNAEKKGEETNNGRKR